MINISGKKEKFYQNYFENQNYKLLLLETNKNLLPIANESYIISNQKNPTFLRRTKLSNFTH